MELEKILLCGEVLGAFFRFLYFGLDAVPFIPVDCVFLQQITVAGVVVEHLRMGPGIAEQDLFALAVHLHQFFAEALQVGLAHDVAVHAGAALAVIKDFATDDKFVVGVDFEFVQDFFDLRFFGNVEQGLDHGLGFAATDKRSLCLVSADKAECLQQYGLTGSGFASDGGKAVTERDFRFGNQCERVYRKLF